MRTKLSCLVTILTLGISNFTFANSKSENLEQGFILAMQKHQYADAAKLFDYEGVSKEAAASKIIASLKRVDTVVSGGFSNLKKIDHLTAGYTHRVPTTAQVSLKSISIDTYEVTTADNTRLYYQFFLTGSAKSGKTIYSFDVHIPTNKDFNDSKARRIKDAIQG